MSEIIVTTKSVLKSYFETGDKPSQEEFVKFLDSYYHKHEGAVIKHPTSLEISEGLSTLVVLTSSGPIRIPVSGNYAGSMQDLKTYIDENGSIGALVNMGTFSSGDKVFCPKYPELEGYSLSQLEETELLKEGWFFVCFQAGTLRGINYNIGDLIVFDGQGWYRLATADNSDTIATKIEITLADLGVATIAEVTDAMVKNHINGLELVKSRKEFYVVSVEELRYIITDLPVGLVNITEDQLLENSGRVSVQESPKDLPKDFFISGWNRGTPSYLIYETDVPNRFFDLRQYVPTMLAVTEILRQPGTNNIICISGWTIGGVVQPIQVIKLIDCKIINNVFTPSGFEFIEFTTTSATHGSDIDDEYIYISTRGTSANYLTVGTDIIKININNFDDNKKLVIEPSSGIVGRSSDIIEYNESLYTVISDSSNTRISKLVKINKNLNDYKSIITINDGTSNSADVVMPFAIYNDEVIMFGIDHTDTNSRKNVVVINVYSITGQLKRKQRLILGSTGTVSYVPHWCTVVNNKLIVSPSGGGDTVADRYIIRVDIGKEYDNNSIILEEVTFSKMLVSDDNSLFSNGMLYIGNETNTSTANAKLVRMPYWDFTQQEVLYSDYSHLASLKIKTTKQTTRPFDTLFYKTKENLPLVGAINILYVVQEGLDKGIYEWYDGVYENLGGSREVTDATSTEKGVIRLGGDLGGTAENPTVPALQDIYTKEEVNAMLSAVYIAKGSVNTYSDLLALTEQEIGWVWNVKSEGKNYAWVGGSADFPNGWDDIGGVFDVSGKEDKSNKKTDVEANKTSNIFYLTAKAVYDFVILKTVRKIESLISSPVQIIRKWNGTQDEMKAAVIAGLDPNTEYAYVKIINVVRKPVTTVTYNLDEFDNETNQIIETDCGLQIPSGVVDFTINIIVLPTATLTLYGAGITNIIPAIPTTGNQILTKGKYQLVQKGETSNFILC